MVESHLAGAVLFDLDGTLVNTLPDMLWAMNAVLTEMGRPAVTTAELRGWIGDGVAALVERVLAATGGVERSALSGVVERFSQRYMSHVAVASTVYPGVEPALRALRAAVYRLGVCTNKPTALSVELLTALGLSPLFAGIVGGDAVTARKPHPEHLLATLAAMDARGCRAMMVGDSANDVAVARAAGVPVVVVSYGYARTAPENLGADAVIDDFAQLPALAGRLL
jgi:phosphoglycolate phosphatase